MVGNTRNINQRTYPFARRFGNKVQVLPQATLDLLSRSKAERYCAGVADYNFFFTLPNVSELFLKIETSSANTIVTVSPAPKFFRLSHSGGMVITTDAPLATSLRCNTLGTFDSSCSVITIQDSVGLYNTFGFCGASITW